jgi:subtilase family serine protease
MIARNRRRHAFRPDHERLDGRLLPSGLTPVQVRNAYGLGGNPTFTVNGRTTPADGRGQTIAIVITHDDPNIFNDVDTFDRTFATGLPGSPSLYSAYGSSSSFLTKYTPQGRPTPDGMASIEAALDVEWAHAIAPGTRIALVEANGDVFGAINYARNLPGVSVVSMSFGYVESRYGNMSSLDGLFTTPAGHTPVTFVAASGDLGANPGLGGGPSYPASSPNVLAVGGTTFLLDAYGNVVGERGWSNGGGGISNYEPEPSYQRAVQSTGHRTLPDVAYGADQNAGFYMVNTVPNPAGLTGRFVTGGTSAGTPQWAGLITIADQGRALAGKATLDGPTQTLPAIYSLRNSGDFHDVTTGSNGYSAGYGYDLVTGVGTPVANRLIGDLAFNVNSRALVASPSSSPGLAVPTATGLAGPTPFVIASTDDPVGLGVAHRPSVAIGRYRLTRFDRAIALLAAERAALS